MSSEQKIITSNVVWHRAMVAEVGREAMKVHRGATTWFAVLYGAEKSTLGHAFEELFYQRGFVQIGTVFAICLSMVTLLKSTLIVPSKYLKVGI